jgi:hypothetical protein
MVNAPMPLVRQCSEQPLGASAILARGMHTYRAMWTYPDSPLVILGYFLASDMRVLRWYFEDSGVASLCITST